MNNIPSVEGDRQIGRELPTFSDETLDRAQQLNDAGRTAEAWDVLHSAGDGYADDAA